MKGSSVVITDNTKELSTYKKIAMEDAYDLYTARDNCKHD